MLPRIPSAGQPPGPSHTPPAFRNWHKALSKKYILFSPTFRLGIAISQFYQCFGPDLPQRALQSTAEPVSPIPISQHLSMFWLLGSPCGPEQQCRGSRFPSSYQCFGPSGRRRRQEQPSRNLSALTNVLAPAQPSSGAPKDCRAGRRNFPALTTFLLPSHTPRAADRPLLARRPSD